MSILKKIQFKVDSNLQELESVLSQFEQIYDNFIPDRDWLKCKLALAEGFTNAVRHAHKNLHPQTPIIIEALLKSRALTIYIWDVGDRFDLDHYIKEKSANNSDWIASGRGVAILTQIADILEYHHLPRRGNCLIIVKKFATKDE